MFYNIYFLKIAEVDCMSYASYTVGQRVLINDLHMKKEQGVVYGFFENKLNFIHGVLDFLCCALQACAL